MSWREFLFFSLGAFGVRAGGAALSGDWYHVLVQLIAAIVFVGFGWTAFNVRLHRVPRGAIR